MKIIEEFVRCKSRDRRSVDLQKRGKDHQQLPIAPLGGQSSYVGAQVLAATEEKPPAERLCERILAALRGSDIAAGQGIGRLGAGRRPEEVGSEVGPSGAVDDAPDGCTNGAGCQGWPE